MYPQLRLTDWLSGSFGTTTLEIHSEEGLQMCPVDAYLQIQRPFWECIWRTFLNENQNESVKIIHISYLEEPLTKDVL